MASSFPESSQGSQKYDVFLNFRGDDVRLKFVSHLIVAFSPLPLKVFVDYEITKGEHIKSALMDAIQDSKLSLTIFSNDYASSEWCLDELEKIMECRRDLKQMVIPVFYHVRPSEVTDVQSGVFAQAFAKHIAKHKSRQSLLKVLSWKAAMEAAGSLSGITVHEWSSEAHVLDDIVNGVLKRLGRNYSMSNRGDGKLKDCPNIQQQQRNVSIWTISRQQRLPVQEDLNKVLTQIKVQVEGNPSESHSKQLETSSSHPSPPISYRSVTTRRKMAATTAPTKSTLTNSSFGSGGGNNINGVNSYGLGSTTVPTSYVTQVGLPMSSNSFASVGGNNINGVNSYGLGSTTVPTSSVTQVGLPMSSNSFASGGGNNINGVNSYGLGSTTVPTSSVRRSSLRRSISLSKLALETGLTNSSFGSGGGNNINGVNSYGLGSTTVPTSSVRRSSLRTSISLSKSALGTGVSPRELGPKTGPNSSVTQVGLPMSSSSFASGGGNNTNGYGLGGNTVPNSSVSMSNGYCCYRLDLGNGNWGYGYPVDYGNGYCGYYVNLRNGKWSYYVDGGNGYLYPYEWYVVEQRRQGRGAVKKPSIFCCSVQ